MTLGQPIAERPGKPYFDPIFSLEAIGYLEREASFLYHDAVWCSFGVAPQKLRREADVLSRRVSHPVSNTGVPSFTFFDEGQATGVPDLLYQLDC
jgi:hypothetical protein